MPFLDVLGNDVDDVAATPLYHRWRCGTGTIETTQRAAVQRLREGFGLRFIGARRQPAVQPHRCVVDQNIDATKLIHHRFECTLDLRAIANITIDR